MSNLRAWMRGWDNAPPRTIEDGVQVALEEIDRLRAAQDALVERVRTLDAELSLIRMASHDACASHTERGAAVRYLREHADGYARSYPMVADALREKAQHIADGEHRGKRK